MIVAKRFFAVLSLIALGLLLWGCNLPAPQGPVETVAPAGSEAPPSPGTGSGSVSGRIWNDLCDPSEADPMPPGCVAGPDGRARANGILDPGETGIAGVLLTLGAGTCPSPGIITVATAGDGSFQIAGLGAGSFCASVDPAGQAVLGAIGGEWTFPSESDPHAAASFTITLAEGESRADVNFGWDYPTLPTPTPAPSSATPTVGGDTPTPTATATPTPSSGDPRARLGEPTWRDPFDTGANWPLYEDDHVKFEIQDGSLKMVARNADHWDGWMLSWPDIRDVYLEITATTGECSGQDHYGVVFRSTSTAAGYVGYFFGISCDGRYSLRTWDGEVFTQIVAWTTSDRIHAGANQANRLGVWADGTRLELYVNGELLTQVTDATHTEGKMGVFVGAARTANFTVRVDEIAFWTVP